MSFGKIVSAAFKIRNFALLAGVLIVFFATGFNLPFLFIGLAGYLYFVLQTLRSEDFQKEYAEFEKLDDIQKLSWECRELYRKIFSKVDKNVRNKISAILKEKDELMSFFSANSDDPLKQKIIEQALKLVMAYINLIFNYSIRWKELSAINSKALAERINNNNRKLGFLKSYDAVLELTKAIEMDEKLMQRISEEREELERTSAKLDYIESTISAFKHRIISKESLDPTVEDIESVLNEAAALDNVLSSKRKDRLSQ